MNVLYLGGLCAICGQETCVDAAECAGIFAARAARERPDVWARKFGIGHVEVAQEAAWRALADDADLDPRTVAACKAARDRDVTGILHALALRVGASS